MDIEALLEPISAVSPCGDDLSFSAEFDAIQHMRREDDPSLEQGEWVRELKVADWAGVLAASESLLRTRTKDLRVVGWLTDAAGRIDGLAGLADGLALCSALVSHQWERLHPLPDGGDQEQRAGNLGWLLGRVDSLAQVAPLALHGGKACSLRLLTTARARQQAAARGAGDASQAGADGAPTLEALQRIVTSAGAPALEARLQQARRAVAALAQLQTEVDARLGADGPAFTDARRTLQEAVDGIERLGRDSGFHAQARAGFGPASESAPGSEPQEEPPAQVQGQVPLRSRAEALQCLREVAEYFRRTEPHSPVAYLADKAARWGDMPLHAWLRSVVKDGGSLAHLEELLGIDMPPPGAGDT